MTAEAIAMGKWVIIPRHTLERVFLANSPTACSRRTRASLWSCCSLLWPINNGNNQPINRLANVIRSNTLYQGRIDIKRGERANSFLLSLFLAFGQSDVGNPYSSASLLHTIATTATTTNNNNNNTETNTTATISTRTRTF